MWNKLTQAAGLGAAASDSTVSEESSAAISEAEEQIAQQCIEIQNLKVIVRENEKLLQEKNKELEEVNSKFQKFKLQSKARICQLSNQLEKSVKKDDGDFEDTSSSDSSDQSKRGKFIVLKKQLEQANQQTEKKKQEIMEMSQNFDAVIKDLHTQLDERDKQILSLKNDVYQCGAAGETKDSSQGDTNVNEMYAQMVYKDSKIMDLSNQILKHERDILDLQEHIKEKDEVLQSRNLAIQLMTADMNRKGKSVVDELDEVRQHMRTMQENFTIAESEWKAEKKHFSEQIMEMIEKFENDIAERDAKVKKVEEAFKMLEVTKHDLATKNAELQRKLVVVQEKADKQFETFQKQMDEDIYSLRRSFEQERTHSLELQEALDEAINQSEAKVLKARVKERTKLKAVERELKALREAAGQIPDEVTHLHHCIAELEEEKGTLQLKLLEVEEQIALQELQKTDKDSLQSSLKETEEKCIQVEMFTSQYEKMSSKKQVIIGTGIEQHGQESKDLSKEVILTEDKAISLEMKLISVEEQQRDEHTKQELLLQIHRFLNLLNSNMDPITVLGKGNNDPDEEVFELDKFHETDLQELHNVGSQSDCFQKELNELQNKCCNIIEENRKFKSENELLISALKDTEEMVKKLNEVKEWLNINNPSKLEITSLIEKCNSQQFALNDLYSFCEVSDLSELKKKNEDMVANIKSLNSAVLDQRIEMERYKEQYKSMVDEVEKLKLDCQNRNRELKSCSGMIENLKMHISTQEKAYKDQINKLNQCIENQEKRNRELVSAVSDREKLLQKAIADMEEKDEQVKKITEDLNQQSHVLCQLEKHNVFLSSEVETLKESKKLNADKMQSKMSSMLEQISDLEAEVSKLQGEVSSKLERCAALEKESTHFKALYDDILEVHQTHSAMCEDHQNMLDNLQLQIISLETDVEKKNEKISHVQRTLKEKDEKDAILKVNQDSINILQTKLNALQAEKEEMLKVNKIKGVKIKELETSLEELNHKLGLEVCKYNNICQEYQCAVNENKILNGQLLDVKNQVESLKTEISNLSLSSSEKDDMNKKLMSDNFTFQMEIGKLRNENEKLLNMLDEAKLGNVMLKKQNSNISSELELAKKDLSAVSISLHDVVVEKETLNQTLAKHAEDLEIAQREVKTLKETCSNLCDENRIPGEEKLDKEQNLSTKEQKNGKRTAKGTTFKEQLKTSDENLHHWRKDVLDVAERVQRAEKLPQTENEVKESYLREITCHTDAPVQETKDLGRENILFEAEQTVPSDIHFSKLKSLVSEINHYQQDLLHVEAENEKYRSILENETKAKLCLQAEVSQYKARAKCLKTVLLSAFQETQNVKSSLLNLRSDTQQKLSQYSLDLVYFKNEFNAVTHSFYQKQDELLMLLNNSMSENAMLRETNCGLNERLHKSSILVQNLTEEGKQQVDDLIGKIQVTEEEYQLSLKREREEHEKYLSNYQKNVEHLALFKTQYLSIADKILNLKRCIIEETGDSAVNEVHEFEFPRDFHVLEDITKSMENVCIDYKHQISKLLSDIKKLSDEKESLVKFTQTIEDENSSFLQRISYLENVKDSLVSSFPALSKEISDITKMNSASLCAVLDSINSKDTVLRNMETSVVVLKNTFSVLKKQLGVLQSENSSLKDKIHCNSKEIVHLQNISDDLLKKNSEVQREKHEVLEKLIEHSGLLQTLGNWVNGQAEKIRHLAELIQMSLESNIISLDKTGTEDRGLQEQRIHSDIKSEEIISTKKQVNELEKHELEHIFHRNIDYKECETSKKHLDIIEEKIKEFTGYSNLKGTDTNNMQEKEENKSNGDVVSNFMSVLQDSEDSVCKLQSQINEIVDERNSSLKCKGSLELYVQANNSLKTEVQDLLSSLSAAEKERLALQQELQHITYQQQCKKTECKEKINSLQAEVNKYAQINNEMAELVKENNNRLEKKEAEYDELQHRYICENEKHNLTKEEITILKSEFEKRCTDKCVNCKESGTEDLRQNMENMLKQNSKMKMHLNSICDMLFNEISCNANIFCKLDINREIEDPNSDNCLDQEIAFLRNSIIAIIKSLTEKQYKLEEALSNLETVNAQKDNCVRTMNDKTTHCEELSVKVKELKELLVESQEKLKLNKEEVKTKGIKADECVVQASICAIESQSEKFQEGNVENLCCNLKSCRLANKSLHHQLNIQKMKYDKMLTKLKISRDQVEEMNDVIGRLKQESEKLTTSRDECIMSQKKQLESHRKVEDDWKRAEEEKNSEIRRLKELVSELKVRNSLENSQGDELRIELQEYKDLWEQSNSTFELQKEENEQLQLKVKEMSDELEKLNLKMSDINNKSMASDAEKKYLQHVVEGLKENINMLISDNDTFQELNEKLSQSKATLEQNVAKLKETNPKEVAKFQSEINELMGKLQVAEGKKTELFNIEVQYEQLKDKYSSLDESKKFLESRMQSILKDKQILENQNKDLYNELFKHADELHHLRMNSTEGIRISEYCQDLNRKKELENEGNQLGEREISQHSSPFCNIAAPSEPNQSVAFQLQNENPSFDSMHAPSAKACLQDSEQQFKELVREKQTFELHIKYLTDELQSAMIKKEAALEEYLTKEKEWKNDSARKETQFQQQITSLQMQLMAATSQSEGGGDRGQKTICNESLLETELQQAMNNLHRQGLRCEELSLEVSKLLEERNDLRLKLSQCHQHSYDELSKSEIGSGTNNSCGDEHPSEEFRILLGDDDDEHEVFIDTSFSITRHMKSTTRKLHRWIRRRRNYLCRMVRSKNYQQVMYLVYLLAVHMWIIVCTFGHS